jgi:hypothetical protein
MYKNMVTQFIEMMRPFIGDKNKRFRMLFIRQSAQKHFPALRKRYLNEQPFMEPMSVPKEQSKLKYSKWEIANNYNSPERVAEADAPSSDEVNSTASLFGQ